MGAPILFPVNDDGRLREAGGAGSDAAPVGLPGRGGRSSGGEGRVPKRSAGILLYRRRNGAVEVLLVHPGGPLWASRDLGAWSIPKGEYGQGEDPLAVALREFEEETGQHPPQAVLVELGEVRQRGGKVVTAWAAPGDLDPAAITSNTFTLEWPPRSGRRREFPEVDRAGWFGAEEARDKLLAAQAELIDRLLGVLAEQ
jgi:predicted NUDIX family NTP pyrophosphohydrolase